MFETVAESEMMTKKWQYKPSFKNGQAREWLSFTSWVYSSFLLRAKRVSNSSALLQIITCR
jgi:hypothetical protein